MTDAEKELINKVRNTRVGENPYESLGDEQTVEMWLEYVTPTLSDVQFGHLSPDLQKKYIALGFDLDYGKLKNASEGVLSYYVNKKKEKLMRTPFSQLTDKDLDLLDLPMMKKLKEQLKSTFVESLLSGGKSSNKLELEYPKDAASKYIKLYGLDELIDYQKYPVAAAEIATKARRSLGIGFIGLAHYLAKLGYNYSSQES